MLNSNESQKYSTCYTIHNSKNTSTKYLISRTETCQVILPSSWSLSKEDIFQDDMIVVNILNIFYKYQPYCKTQKAITDYSLPWNTTKTKKTSNWINKTWGIDGAFLRWFWRFLSPFLLLDQFLHFPCDFSIILWRTQFHNIYSKSDSTPGFFLYFFYVLAQTLYLLGPLYLFTIVSSEGGCIPWKLPLSFRFSYQKSKITFYSSI